MSRALQTHMDSGVTHVCRCWRIERRDGVRFGFTDHDKALKFDGTDFLPGTGLSASALEKNAGLAPDNSEALGLLQDASVREEDILAGRFDDARVTAWIVRWDDVSQRRITFSGLVGQIKHGSQAFEVELVGLSDLLNRPGGPVYQSTCAAVLGDKKCGVDLRDSAHLWPVSVGQVDDASTFSFTDTGTFPEGWFSHGAVLFTSGANAGLRFAVKVDRLLDGRRHIGLWQTPALAFEVGDACELTVGCDRMFATCRDKFANATNFRGFPHLPDDDWVSLVPRSGELNDGGSLNH